METRAIFDITKLAAERLAAPLSMDGMSRTVMNWARLLAGKEEALFYSAIPEAWLKRIVADDPVFKWLPWERLLSPDSGGKSASVSGLRWLMVRHDNRSSSARLRRRMAYHWIDRLHEQGIQKISAAAGEGDAKVMHFPYPRIFKLDKPRGIRPLMNFYDVAQDIFQDTYPDSSRRKARAAIRCVKDANAHVVVNSRDVRHSMVCMFDLNPDKVHVVPLGATGEFDGERGLVAPEEKPSGKPYFIATNSGWQRRKNLRSTLRAFLQFKARTGSEWELVLTGVGSENVFVELGMTGEEAAANGIRGLGYVDGARLGKLIKNAGCGLYLSLYEGFGLPPLEFMRQGVPVISSHNGAVAEVTSGSAFSVDPLSVREISEAMERVSSSEPLREELSEKGLQRARSYTWESSVEKLCKVYEAILTDGTVNQRGAVA